MVAKYKEWEVVLIYRLYNTRGYIHIFKILDEEGGIKYSKKEVDLFISDLLSGKLLVQQRAVPSTFRLTLDGRNHFSVDIDLIANEYENLSKSREGLDLPDELNEKIKKGVEKAEKSTEKATTKNHHALSNNAKDPELLEKGYQNQGLIGYVYHSFSGQENRKSLEQIFFNDTNSYFYYLDPGSEKLKGRDYSGSKHIGYVLWDKGIPLFRYWREQPYGHFYCTNPNKKLIEASGFSEDLVNGFERTYLLPAPIKDETRPLYVYSTNPEILLFEPLGESQNQESSNKRIFDQNNPYVPDGLAKEDELGRKVLMKVVHNKVKEYWEDEHQQDSFTILINGEWGSGKSSMLFYLKGFLESEEWSVIEYNAWRNQRFAEPWWFFVNKISKEVPRLSDKGVMSRSHRSWKNRMQYSIMYIGAFITSVLLIFGFSNDVFGNTDNLTFYASIVALIGSLWVSVNGAVQNVFKKKSFAEYQAKNANDPLEPYKERFNEVVKDKKVAIFIDDLDRCEVDATVKLLEGIQTLFKESKVLYVVAADGHWVANCFDQRYEGFDGLTENGQSIGNQFLQKSFQLIVDVPRMNKRQVEKLLKKHLNRDQGISSSSDEIHYAEEEIAKIDNADMLRDIAAKGDESTRRAATARVGNTSKKEEEEFEHFILEFHKNNDLPLNPRQLKRLINLYTMKTAELTNSQVSSSEVSKEVIMKYVLFSTEYAACNQKIRSLSEAEFLEKYEEILDKFDGLTYDIMKSYF